MKYPRTEEKGVFEAQNPLVIQQPSIALLNQRLILTKHFINGADLIAS